MDEYIEREALRKVMQMATDDPTCPMHIAATVDQYITEAPAADVAPVRHGQWDRTADGAALCTACKQKMNPSQYGYAFCSLCGAKMDGGVDGG